MLIVSMPNVCICMYTHLRYRPAELASALNDLRAYAETLSAVASQPMLSYAEAQAWRNNVCHAAPPPISRPCARTLACIHIHTHIRTHARAHYTPLAHTLMDP
jgi:hypothetical protein